MEDLFVARKTRRTPPSSSQPPEGRDLRDVRPHDTGAAPNDRHRRASGPLHRRQYVSRCSRPSRLSAAPMLSQFKPAWVAISLSASTTPSSIDLSPQT